jgi:shikimate kinase
MADRAIILMGLRGSGKTTVGRLLAARLTRRFIDLDDQTLAILGAVHGVSSIAQAFKELGETTFRRAEVDALGRALKEASVEPAVISLGGGTPTAPGASALLRECGAVLVYLRYPPDVLAERLRDQVDDRRPALTARGDPIAEIDEIFRARDPRYRDLSSIVVEESGTPEDVVRSLVDRLGLDAEATG